MDSKYNPLNYAQDAADWAADKSADAGWSPAVSTALKAAPAALAALTGTAGLLRGAAPAALRGIKNVTGYAEPAKLDTAAATVTRTPEEVLAQAAQRQSIDRKSVV